MAADFEIRVPFKPVWTEEAQRPPHRLKKEIGTVGVPSTRGAGGGGIASGIKSGVGAALGIGGVVVIVAQILNQFKPMIRVAQSIVKILIEFLRPIADVITLLLLPVLQILKPILMIVRQIMAPFRKASLQLSAEGSKALKEGRKGDAAALFGLSIQTGIAGLSAVVLTLMKDTVNLVITGIGEFVKTIVDVMLTSLAFVVGIFSKTGAEKILEFKDNILSGIDTVVENITDFIDATVGIIIASQAASISEVAKRFGVDLSGTFLPEVVKAIDQVIVDGDNSV